MLMRKKRLATKRGRKVLALQLQAWTFESHFWDADPEDLTSDPTCVWCGYAYKRRSDGLLKGAPLCLENPVIKRRLQDGS
jgi:hypothetical protein